MNHLLKLLDLTGDEIIGLLNLADQLKYEHHHNIPHRKLEGKTLAMIFQKSSTRTRVSFESGMYQLGGHALVMSASDLQMGRGEPIYDTARVLSRYCDGIMIRTYAQEDVEELARVGSIPVINGLTDFCHPCQILADLMTIREYKQGLSGLKLAFIGDTNNMSNSLIVGCLKVGMQIACAYPEGYAFPKEILDFAAQYDGLTLTHDPLEAAAGADVLETDVWASMGEEGEAEKRRRDFAGYQINDQVMAAANPDAMILHCLPAHRGEEITASLFEAHANEIFDEAENRMHAQKAVLLALIGKEPLPFKKENRQ